MDLYNHNHDGWGGEQSRGGAMPGDAVVLLCVVVVVFRT
jgi:hypothetical protein